MLIKKSKSEEKGFSLVEMLIVTVVFLAVIAVSLQLIQLANFDVRTSKNINEVHMNGRSAMKFLERDITNAGSQILRGAGATGGASGPVISRSAFTTITSIPVPAGNNNQEFFCIIPVNKEDNLNNGAGRFGRADRLTVSYSDEFFDGGTQQVLNSGTTVIREKSVNTLRGLFNRANQIFTTRNENVLDPDTANPGGRVRTTYTVRNVKAGDIFQVTINAETTPILLMATGVNIDNNTISFSINDFLGFNRKSPAGTYGPPGSSPPILTSFDPQAFPMDALDIILIPASDPQNLVPVELTKVNIYSYQVDVNTRELTRRRYTLFADDTPLGFIDDPVCQGVERFWLSYNLFQSGNSAVVPPIPPKFTEDRELDPKADINVLNDLQFISRINSKLIVRSQEIDRRNGRPSRLALEGSFTPRNIAYAGNQEKR